MSVRTISSLKNVISSRDCSKVHFHPLQTLSRVSYRHRSHNYSRLKSARSKSSATPVYPSNNVASSTVSMPSSSSSSVIPTKLDSVPLGRTLVAMAFGVTTVAASAVAVESYTAENVPPFDPSGQRFDQSSFLGRFSKMILACDPRLLLYSEEETRRCRTMVQDYENLLANLPDGVTLTAMHRALWEAQRISSAALHPDTGDAIPHPFRMSGYVPFNGPICVAMVASTSTPALLFWSWVNQSQNALVNYYNRNASSEMSNETLIKSYSAAVASALTVAFGLATFIQRRFDPVKAKQLMKYVAFPSAVVASSLNCYIVRSPEITTGVPLVDEDGNDVFPGQRSKVAATIGVNSTTASRALLQAPVYFLPPVLLGYVPALKSIVTKNPALSVPITTFLVLVSFGLGLPATVAIFPQMSEIDVKDVEEEFRVLRRKDGLPYDKFYYNKGL